MNAAALALELAMVWLIRSSLGKSVSHPFSLTLNEGTAEMLASSTQNLRVGAISSHPEPCLPGSVSQIGSFSRTALFITQVTLYLTFGI